MRSDRVGSGALAAWVGVLLVLGAVPGAEGAVDGPCQVTVADQDVALHDPSAENAIRLPANGTIPYRLESDVPIVRYELVLHFATFSLRISNDTIPEGTGVIDGVASVEEYAWMGGGVYRVTGDVEREDGSDCTATAIVDVEGPWFNALVGAAALAILGGGAGLVAVFVNMLLQLREVRDAVKDFREGYKGVG